MKCRLLFVVQHVQTYRVLVFLPVASMTTYVTPSHQDRHCEWRSTQSCHQHDGWHGVKLSWPQSWDDVLSSNNKWMLLNTDVLTLWVLTVLLKQNMPIIGTCQSAKWDFFRWIQTAQPSILPWKKSISSGLQIEDFWCVFFGLTSQQQCENDIYWLYEWVCIYIICYIYLLFYLYIYRHIYIYILYMIICMICCPSISWILRSWKKTFPPKSGAAVGAAIVATPFLERKCFSGWWFLYYFHSENWGNDPIWLIFFKWVEATN